MSKCIVSLYWKKNMLKILRAGVLDWLTDRYRKAWPKRVLIQQTK